MRVGGEKCTVEQVIKEPKPQGNPVSDIPDATSKPCPAEETLIERVVDFMDTYNEN